MFDYDLMIVGSGPAGEKAAIEASRIGASVAVIEKERLPGGTCANTGTLPSKTLRESALFAKSLRSGSIGGYNLPERQSVGISQFMQRERRVVDGEIRRIREAFRTRDITLIHGRASFVDEHTVAIEDRVGTRRTLTANRILVATGSRPRRTAHIPFEHEKVHDSDMILRMQSIPDNMVVIGGGVVATEYASIFQTLGVAVTMIVRAETVLGFLDREIAVRAIKNLENIGVYVILEAEEEKVEITGDGTLVVTLSDGRTVPCESLLYAAGRDGNTDALNLEKVGVDMTRRGHIKVDEHMSTSNPNIYAAGDVIGWPALASASMMQGRVAATWALDASYKLQMPREIPYGVYTVPTISYVGLTEQECKDQGVRYEVARAEHSSIARAQIAGTTEGLLKIIFDPDTLEMLGIHIIGNRSTELIHIGLVAMANGAHLDYFEEAVFNYPTYAGMYKICARNGLFKLRGDTRQGHAQEQE